MPLKNCNYEKILDDIYETASEGECEYFSDNEGPLWAQGAIARLPIASAQPVEHVRVRRKKSQRKTQLKLKIQNQMFAAVVPSKTDALPRLPAYIPPFNERTVSAPTVTLPVQLKPLKRWQSSSSSSAFDLPSTSKGVKSKSRNFMPSAAAENLPGWSVDESDMSVLDLDGPSIRKYNEFKAAIAAANCCPTDSRHFDGRRWDLKLTHQKNCYRLYRIKLAGQYRAAFIINNDERKVMMMTASSHEG
ncbi:hypothetical protein GE278_08240 [Enterobacteriaceae bacterium Kacie_13]|nr:hypothetical protein GE278_08240 [Enterobacteriaceae bacterium Kacie_13]